MLAPLFFFVAICYCPPIFAATGHLSSMRPESAISYVEIDRNVCVLTNRRPPAIINLRAILRWSIRLNHPWKIRHNVGLAAVTYPVNIAGSQYLNSSSSANRYSDRSVDNWITDVDDYAVE